MSRKLEVERTLSAARSAWVDARAALDALDVTTPTAVIAQARDAEAAARATLARAQADHRAAVLDAQPGLF